MYQLDLVERLKLRTADVPEARKVAAVAPAVWNLGWTSFFTDVSSEMVNSILPVYLIVHLHLSPVQYGAVDGIYNGFAVALLSLAAGIAADRRGHHKQIAAAGYGLSTLCKLALLAAGGVWTAITAALAMDRLGKGIRTAPRDALISLHTQRDTLATAFAAHRALDAGGTLIGPAVAFALLWWTPGAFDVVWIASFALGAVGLAILILFVPRPPQLSFCSPVVSPFRSALALFRSRRFSTLAICGFALALATVSDGFFYLQLQRKSGIEAGFFPLFYVLTACSCMLFSFPAGRVADRLGRLPVFLTGYLMLSLAYLAFQALPAITGVPVLIFAITLGVYYAATEGILMAMTSEVVPAELRTSGLAIIATCVGLGKMISSLLFGYFWNTFGAGQALWIFASALLLIVIAAAGLLRTSVREILGT